MKSKKKLPTHRQPTEDEIRDYAAHLYQQGGCQPGHDLDNWFEAKACLEANIPKAHSRTRLHRHRRSPTGAGVAFIGVTTREEVPGGEGVVLEEYSR